MMTAILAQAASDTSIAGAWDVAQKVGAGGALVLIVVVIFLWKAYLAKDKQLTDEVTYSKDRDKQTLTVMIELTALIRGIDKRDIDSAGANAVSTKELMTVLAEIKGLIKEHINKSEPNKA